MMGGSRRSALGTRLPPRDIPVCAASNSVVAESREPRAGSGVGRRGFLLRAGAMLVGGTVLVRQASAQDQPSSGAANVPMQQGAYRPVERPAKADAKPQLTKEQRDDLERRIACQCGCTLDIYTCRTTDFSCQVSPAMHADVNALVAGGYSAQEIIDAFNVTYGEQVLMAPKREGFNLVGYFMPFAALATGAAVVAVLLRKWSRRAAATAAARAAEPVPAGDGNATADEMAQLEAAVRGDDR